MKAKFIFIILYFIATLIVVQFKSLTLSYPEINN